MHLSTDTHIFVPDHTVLEFERSFESTRATLLASIVIGSDMMIDFQKEIFEELLAGLSELLSDEAFDFDDFKQSAEYAFQQTNLQLQAFAEKTSSEQHREIRGSIQCVVGNDYLATMIGSTGLAIVRNHKTQYLLTNDTHADGIDQFSDLVEGEVLSGDSLLTTGFALEQYIDADDITVMHDLVASNGTRFVDELLRIIGVRIPEEEIQFIKYTSLTSDLAHTTQEVSKRFEGPAQMLIQKLGGKQQAKTIAMYAGIGILALVLLGGLINSFSDTTTSSFVSTTTGSPVPITITSIQKEIADFQNMPATSDQKALVYESIVDKLDTLDDNDKWTNDVSELRKILETQYYQGFNILLVNNDSFFRDAGYSFTQQEKNVLGQPQEVFFTDNLMVGGENGALIGVINETLRGTLVAGGIDQQFEQCSLNIYRNGLYCVDDTNQIFMVSKTGVEPVNTSGSFPNDIVDVGIYGNRNFYTLTQDPAQISNGSYIQRYSAAGSQTEFGEGLAYQLADTALVGSGVDSFVVDGTFMIWDNEYGLTQRRRDGASTTLNSRVLELGGGSVLQQYSDQTRVISYETSNYVYLVDPETQSFTTYRSTPYKTNDAYTTSYNLEYLFRIKFTMDDFEVRDVYVEEGEQAVLHVLTDDGVYTMNLGQYRNDYLDRVDS